MSVTVSGREEPSEELAGRQSQPAGQRVARGPVLQEPCPQYVQWVSSSEGSGTILCIYLFVLKHMLTYPGEALFPPEGSDISEGMLCPGPTRLRLMSNIQLSAVSLRHGQPRCRAVLLL